MKNLRKPIFLITAALALIVTTIGATSCSDSSGPSDATGTLRMELVDAPIYLEGVEAITIIFAQVMVHKNSDAEPEGEDGEWIVVLPDTLSEAARTFDLLEYVNGASALLGEVELEAGTYSQIRIFIESATVTIDGEVHDLFIPGGTQSGLKLVNAFHVSPGVITELIMDFDAGQSVRVVGTGNPTYQLQPTIRMTQRILSGTISGTITPTGIDALVTAVTPGTADTITTTYADNVTGAFVLQALLEGSYDIIAGAPGYASAVVENVAVTAGADTPDIDFTLTPEGGR